MRPARRTGPRERTRRILCGSLAYGSVPSENAALRYAGSPWNMLPGWGQMRPSLWGQCRASQPAIRTFQRSYRADTSFGHLVDLATALEATLASGERDNEGLTLRLRNGAAGLLATDNDPATSVFMDVGLLYSLRSKLLHGGRITEKELRKTLERISTVPMIGHR